MRTKEKVKSKLDEAAADGQEVTIYAVITANICDLEELKSNIESYGTIDEAVLVFPTKPVIWE